MSPWQTSSSGVSGVSARRPPAERRPKPSLMSAGRSTWPMFPLAPDNATLVMQSPSTDGTAQTILGPSPLSCKTVVAAN